MMTSQGPMNEAPRRSYELTWRIACSANTLRANGMPDQDSCSTSATAVTACFVAPLSRCPSSYFPALRAPGDFIAEGPVADKRPEPGRRDPATGILREDIALIGATKIRRPRET
jgi:hypothetical protein